MQPVEARKGVPAKSQLFDSLKVYLNSSNRLQPIIGLGSIIECVNAGTHNREILYLCEVCVCRLSKADIRNHIMGSLHRYNYIKTWHPHLVSEWKDDAGLSKLAWPLMEKATTIEGKEGPGDVQLLEFEDAVYQRMATCSENDAIILINILRDEQGEHESYSETASVQLEHSPIQSHRIVLLSHNQPGWSEKSLRMSAETNRPHSLTQSTVAPSVKSESWLSNTSVQMSPKTSVLSENSSSFLDGYTGTKPLIGLHRVVECRSEDGHTYCLLCHCCRIRANKKDIIDHLTSSSHLKNYLMETHPEQVEVMMTDLNDQLLQSLAKKVEQENGRGELRVVKAPESLCLLLTGKSYHWCLKMLCNGYTHTYNQKRKIGVKGPNVNKTSKQSMSEKCAARIKRRKKKIKSNTEFKVSLPLSEGSMLLKRTSFSMDSLPVSPEYSLPADCDLIPSPEALSEDCELNCDTGSFAVNHGDHTSNCTTSQLQQDLYSGDAYAGQSVVCHQLDGYFSDKEYFNPSEYTTVTKDTRSYGERNDNTQHASQKGSNKRYYKEWQNENPQTQNEWLSSAVSRTQDCSSYTSSYEHLDSCTEQWHSSTSQCEAGTREEVSREERLRMSSNATWYYYQQQPQYQYMLQHHASPLTGSVGQHASSSFVLAPHFSAAWMYMQAHSGNIVPGPGVQLQQTHMGITIDQTAPQSYMAQPEAQQAIREGHWVLSNHNSSIGPTTSQ
uniref:uncharacterized protein LOC124074604 n=1 Tax=Scatophagus argus TaxID=75038 RepID=UPI001ED80EF1|nr:uncharacterized protein LOC124074604 [Scatophagus argus]XP_046273650.1 uncharacterized protein LOC124074604 [Scatophagus argus]XP_046273651.1 uncharacterized protein LOC124074604 [Scatophagus argus]XP_046273652.1 uncharacterized protein LOC124074604 [Scatophagus argus]